MKAENVPQTLVPHFPGTMFVIIRLLGFANLLWKFFVVAFVETVSEHVW